MGELTAIPRPFSYIYTILLRGELGIRDGTGKGRGREDEGEGRGGKEKEGEGPAPNILA